MATETRGRGAALESKPRVGRRVVIGNTRRRQDATGRIPGNGASSPTALREQGKAASSCRKQTDTRPRGEPQKPGDFGQLRAGFWAQGKGPGVRPVSLLSLSFP